MRPTFQLFVILTAVFGLTMGAAFAGGSAYGRRSAPNNSTTAQATTTPGGTGSASGSAAQAGAGAPTAGVVEQVNGDTATIRTQAGSTVTVTLQPDTQVRQLAPATAADLRPGMTVSVTGQPDTDGKVAARSIQIGGVPAGQAGLAGRSAGAGAPAPSPSATPSP